MLVVSFIILVVWQIPLTGTAGKITNLATNNNQKNIAATVTATSASGGVTVAASTTPSLGVGAAALVAISPIIAPPGGEAAAIYNGLRTAFFVSDNPNTDQAIMMAQTHAINTFGASAGYDIFPDASTTNYTPVPINENIQVSPVFPEFISDSIDFLAGADRFIFIDIFTIIGIVGTYIQLRRRRKPSESTNGTYDFILLNIGSYLLIVLMLIVPYLQAYYNFTRLYLQMFLVLTILAVAGGVIATQGKPKYQMAILTGMAVLMFCSLTGALDQFTGGDARITLAQPPSTLEAPYIYDTEVAGARWLAANRDGDFAVQADDVANLRLESFGNLGVADTALFPQTIQRDSYVYLISDNIQKDEAFYQYANNVLVYNYPIDFLNSNKNLIYNDGGSRIYK
jgi:hypothetical protein